MITDDMIERVKMLTTLHAACDAAKTEVESRKADSMFLFACEAIDFRALHDLLRRQQAVIEKLPHTADGVPVTPGMKIFFVCREGFIEPYVAVGGDAGSILTYPDKPPAETHFSDDLDGMAPCRCYFTIEAAREAAESARAATKENAR